MFEGFVIGMIIADILACTNAIAKILQHDQIQAPNNGRNITMKNFHDKLEAYNTTSTQKFIANSNLHQTFVSLTSNIWCRNQYVVFPSGRNDILLNGFYLHISLCLKTIIIMLQYDFLNDLSVTVWMIWVFSFFSWFSYSFSYS